jgi:hypothetical protein
LPPAVRSHSCCDGSSPERRQAEAILGLCARAVGNPAQYCRLVVETDGFTGWRWLPGKAELHGLGPLLYTHLKATDSLAPVDVWREIKGLYLRHRHANQLRAEALKEILQAFEAASIQSLALKGIALAHLVYPEPGMRPMRDIDLLVPEPEIEKAAQTLIQLGYRSDDQQARMLPPGHHHIPALGRQVEGMTLNVELHHRLYPEVHYYPSYSFLELSERSVPFQLNGLAARTLGYEDLLEHVYRHALGPPLLGSDLRYVWIADLVSLVEKYVDSIDWERLKSQSPRTYNILPLLHFLTPWPEDVLHRLPFEMPSKPRDVGQDYNGWPRRRLAGRRRESAQAILRETFSPPEWWLRLFYGVGDRHSWLWNRWVRHPVHVLQWVGHYAKVDLFGQGA